MRSQTFNDFDAFAESVHDVDCRMVLRNPERRVWSVTGVDVDTIDVQLGRLGSGNIAQGQTHQDGYMLYVPLTSGVEYAANGCVVEKDACVVMDPGCEFCISTKVAHDWGAVFIPTKYLARTGELLEFPTYLHGAQCRATLPNRETVVRLRALIQDITTAASELPLFESTQAAKNAAVEIFQSVSSLVRRTLPSESQRPGRPHVSREEVVRRSMEFLEQQLPTSVHVGKLAAAAGVSERTLRTVFNEFFGVGPVRYLCLRRLNQIHRALKVASCDETTVTQLLLEHGEWAPSRFARRYHQLYGKRPSETLRTTHR